MLFIQRDGKSNRKDDQYEDDVIALCGPPEVKAKMVNWQEKMKNVSTCPKCGRYLACYVGTGYGNPYNNLQGHFGVNLRTVLDEKKARESKKCLIYYNTHILNYHGRRRYALLGRNYYTYMMVCNLGWRWINQINYETSLQLQFIYKNCK